MPSDSFAIDSRRRRRRSHVQHVQHLLAAALLIWSGLTSLNAPGSHHVVLPSFCIAAGAFLLLAAIREKVRRHSGGGGHHGMAWLEIGAAVVALAEAFERTEGHHHTSFKIAAFLPPVVIAVFGWMEVRGTSGVFLRDDGRRLILQLSFLRRHRIVEWEAVRSYAVTADAIELATGDGKPRKLPLADVINRDELLAWFAARAASRGLAAQ